MTSRWYGPRRSAPAPKPTSELLFRDAKEALADRLELALKHRPGDTQEIAEMREQLENARFIGYAVTVTISRHYQTLAYAGTTVSVIKLYQGIAYVCGSPPFRLVTNEQGQVVREIWTKYGQESPFSRSPTVLVPECVSQWNAPRSEMNGIHRVIFFPGEEGREPALAWADVQKTKQV